MAFISITHSKTKQRSKRYRRTLVAIVLFFFTLVLIGTIAVTMSLGEANRLMREEPTELITFASNLMPSREVAVFKSADRQTNLSGWFFATPSKKPNGTIIISGHKNHTRLPYGLDTPAIFKQMTAAGFNILCYDVRRNGESVSEMHTYGYAESYDVLGAIAWVKRRTDDSRILLMGIGSGVTSTLHALEYIENPPQSLLDSKDKQEKALLAHLKSVEVIGFILDSPLDEASDYVKLDLAKHGWLKRSLYNTLVPYAVRLTAGGSNAFSLVTAGSISASPMLILGNKEVTRNQFCKERVRLHSNTTVVEIEGNSVGQSFSAEPTKGTEALKSFLSKWFPKQ